jgi:hypothetical protein
VRGFASLDSAEYRVQAALSVFFMMFVWLLIAWLAFGFVRNQYTPPLAILVTGILFYFLLIHTFFGSGGRHQILPVGFALLLCGFFARTAPLANRREPATALPFLTDAPQRG